MPDLTINGYKHHYEEFGSGEPILFLYHLCTRNARTLAKLISAEVSDFRIIIPDARSMGESEHVADVNPEDWVADVLGLLDALELPSVHIMAGNVATLKGFCPYSALWPFRCRIQP